MSTEEIVVDSLNIKNEKVTYADIERTFHLPLHQASILLGSTSKFTFRHREEGNYSDHKGERRQEMAVLIQEEYVF
jgi:hypothetical protein